MKKRLFFISIILIVVVSATTLSVYRRYQVTGTTVKVFFIALEDDGKSGKKIGCNDSAVGVKRQVAFVKASVQGAIEALLAIKDQHYGQSGLYNALSSANLRVDNVTIENGKATINLSGTYTFTGVCEDARFTAQIEETALQFTQVKEAEIILNGQSLSNLYKGG